MNRHSWTQQEDQAITFSVSLHGLQDWTRIASQLKVQQGGKKRTGKQCRQRWYNHLSPSVSKLPWTITEEQNLFSLHKDLGNRWKDISKYFPGRTDNDIKNHFYSTLRRSLRRLNKALGKRNSTTQMREIKPSVLSSIMKYVYQRSNNSQNKYFHQSLQDLPSILFNFASSKPSKTTKYEELNDVAQIFALISQFSIQYSSSKQKINKNCQLINYKKTLSVNSDQPQTQLKSQENVELFTFEEFNQEIIYPKNHEIEENYENLDHLNKIDRSMSQISLDAADLQVQWIQIQQPSKMSDGEYEYQFIQKQKQLGTCILQDYLGWQQDK